jgi:hypothetical protein
MEPCKFSLSAPRQQLLQIMQQLPFGIIENLVIRGKEPSLSPPPKITREIKLGVEANTRPSPEDGDFLLKRHVTDLFEHFDQLRDGTVVTIEVRHGLPARLILAGEV